LNASGFANIRLRLYALVACATLPALLIISYTGMVQRDHAVEHANQILEYYTDSTAAIEVEKTRQVESLLKNLVLLTKVKRMEAAGCDVLFGSILRQHPELANITLADLQGDVLASGLASGPPGAEKVNVADRRAFQDALRTHAFSAGEYTVGRYSKRPVLPFGVPVVGDGGDTVAVLLCSLRVEEYGGFLNETTNFPDRRMLILDRDGVRLWVNLSQGQLPAGNPIKPENWRIVAESKNDSGKFTETRYDGVPSLFSFRKLRLSPDQPPYLVVLTDTPQEIVLAAADRSLLVNIGLLVLAAAAAMLIARWLGNHLVGRQVELLRANEALLKSSEARLKKSEALLKSSEAQLKLFIEHAPAAIAMLDKDLRYLSVSRRWLAEFGLVDQELTGRSHYEVFPELPERWKEVYHRCLAGAVESAEEDSFTTADGRTRWVRWEVRPWHGDSGEVGGLLYFCKDITEARKAREALRQSEEKFKSIFASTPEPVSFMTWEEARYVEVNEALLTSRGYTRDEVLGRSSLELDTWADQRERDRFRAELAVAKKVRDMEVRLRTKSGEIRTVILSADLLELDGRLYMLCVNTDISERKGMEAELLRAKQVAEVATSMKNEFLANMSHEIRTPLNGLLGMLQLLQTTYLGDVQKNYLTMAIQSSQRLTRLLSDILDLSRIEAGKLVIEEQEFEIGQQKKTVLELFTLPARDKGLELEFAIDKDMPPVLIGDEARLRQILFNLVGNAIKFTQSGHVRVDATPLHASGDADLHVLFTVSDTGVGISDEHLGKIFEPFVQAEESFTRRFQGAGLGLSIVCKLVGLMDGELAIDNSEGAGTTIYVSLPFSISEASADRAQDEPLQRQTQAAKSLRILLAEDEVVNLVAFKMLLEKRGHAVTTAHDGKEALRRFSEKEFDVVLMDIQMPVMDGLEAIKLVRDRSLFGYKADIPVVAMTGYAMAGDKEKFLAAGMTDHIAKPIDYGELDRVLERVTGQGQAGKGA